MTPPPGGWKEIGVSEYLVQRERLSISSTSNLSMQVKSLASTMCRLSASWGNPLPEISSKMADDWQDWLPRITLPLPPPTNYTLDDGRDRPRSPPSHLARASPPPPRILTLSPTASSMASPRPALLTPEKTHRVWDMPPHMWGINPEAGPRLPPEDDEAALWEDIPTGLPLGQPEFEVAEFLHPASIRQGRAFDNLSPLSTPSSTKGTNHPGIASRKLRGLSSSLPLDPAAGWGDSPAHAASVFGRRMMDGDRPLLGGAGQRRQGWKIGGKSTGKGHHSEAMATVDMVFVPTRSPQRSGGLTPPPRPSVGALSGEGEAMSKANIHRPPALDDYWRGDFLQTLQSAAHKDRDGGDSPDDEDESDDKATHPNPSVDRGGVRVGRDWDDGGAVAISSVQVQVRLGGNGEVGSPTKAPPRTTSTKLEESRFIPTPPPQRQSPHGQSPARTRTPPARSEREFVQSDSIATPPKQTVAGGGVMVGRDWDEWDRGQENGGMLAISSVNALVRWDGMGQEGGAPPHTPPRTLQQYQQSPRGESPSQTRTPPARSEVCLVSGTVPMTAIVPGSPSCPVLRDGATIQYKPPSKHQGGQGR